MNLPTLKKILLRLYRSYVKKHLYKLVIALFLSFGVAAGTAAIAWLLDPAVKQIFIGAVELSIVANWSDGYKFLIGGNTRLTAMMKIFGEGYAWQFNVPDVLE